MMGIASLVRGQLTCPSPSSFFSWQRRSRLLLLLLQSQSLTDYSASASASSSSATVTSALPDHRYSISGSSPSRERSPCHASVSSNNCPSSRPLFLMGGVLGASLLFETALADTDTGSDSEGHPPETMSNFDEMEKIAVQERRRLEELLRTTGMQRGSYPPFSIAVKGQKVTVRFQIPTTCEVSHVIVDLVSNLGRKFEDHSSSEMIVRTWESEVAWQLTLYPMEPLDRSCEDGDMLKSKDIYTGQLCVLIFKSLLSSKNSEIEFIKQGNFDSKELDAMVSVLKLSAAYEKTKKSREKKIGGYTIRRDGQYEQLPPADKTLASLEAMGVRVYGVDKSHGVPDDGMISWDNIAGYDHQKREIEDTILLALQNPNLYDDIARCTRQKFESNRPRAILFEGPPGTGKTSCARVIANQAGVPLLYVPLEIVMSKYYGESERLLGSVFSLADELPDGAIIFLDEVDSFAATRDTEMHEATRRLLSVILRQIDGFEQEKMMVVIAATNRKEDLDPALISRFDSIISFDLPNQSNRVEIAAQYAKHLNKHELVQFSAFMEEMSGRDIRDVCQQAERSWASKIIRGEVPFDANTSRIPPLEEYLRCAQLRQKSLLDIAEKKSKSRAEAKKMPLALL